MSKRCKAVALVAHKSLHGCGIVCWCSHSGKPGTMCNSLSCLNVRLCSTKAHRKSRLTDRDAKQKGQSILQDRLKTLRVSVTTAGTRVQDSIHSSRDKFLSSFYSLHTPENGEAKTGEIKSDRGLCETKAFKDYDLGAASVDKDQDSKNSSERSASCDIKELNNIQEESSADADAATDPATHPAKGNSLRYAQTDFWINIPSFQDRINRLKAPFWKTSAPSSTSVSDAEASQGKPASTDQFTGAGQRALWHDNQDTQRKSPDSDSLKPESYHVTADSKPLADAQPQETDNETLKPFHENGIINIPGAGVRGSTATHRLVQSFPSLKTPEEGKMKVTEAKSVSVPDDFDAFDLKASPILSMNMALLDESRGRSSEIAQQVSSVKETVKEAKMRKDRASEEEASVKKPRRQLRPVISKSCIDDRTKNLAIGICNATSNSMRLLKLERLAAHLIQYPESREVAVKEKLIPALLKIQTSWDRVLAEQVNETLALLGYAAPVKGRGLRILSIDGGGTRGVMAIETLREIERRTNKPIRELFDYVMGVSSGAVLGFLLAFDNASLDECEELYMELSQEVFKRNTILGTGKLVLSHAFYDTEGWVKILKAHSLGDIPMISTARQASCPKVAAVATLMNVGYIKDFLFRNYNLPPGTQSHYRGSCKYDLWQAARASSAAPGYFEECKLDENIFQDGGVLTNNPCALAIHECRLLWPDTPIQCVLSVGCGRYDPEDSLQPEYSSLRKKLTNIMISATDTESVHTVLQDLLPSGTYFRFNPAISEDFLLDENRPEKILQMQQEAQDYLELNELKLIQASGVLAREKTVIHKALDWLRLQRQLRS